MDKFSVQGLTFMFDQFKNATTTETLDKMTTGCYIIGLYFTVLGITKTVHLLPPFLDDLIKIVTRFGELCMAVVTAIPRFLESVTASLGLFWSLVYAVVWFILTPAYHLLCQIGILICLLIQKIKNFIIYCKNGFKWPEEIINQTPMLESTDYRANPVRRGRNSYGFGRLNV